MNLCRGHPVLFLRTAYTGNTHRGQPVCCVLITASNRPLTLQFPNMNPFQNLAFGRLCLAVLTKAGCNSGQCHGSASGKDRFRLSPYEFDPAGDHYRLLREIPDRQISVLIDVLFALRQPPCCPQFKERITGTRGIFLSRLADTEFAY